MKHCLIVEGGGFKTGFTSGILDAFIASGFDPFDMYIGVSGGAVASSYFLSRQYRYALLSILDLAQDQNFLNFRRTFGAEGYMDIDMLSAVAQDRIPFNIDKALKDHVGKDVRFVVTNRTTGDAHYLRPDVSNWLDVVTASCTLPFVTKGQHMIDGVPYFDGGWSDALPVRWAYQQGATKITVLRTWPKETITTQSWADYFGSIYFRSAPALSQIFGTNYENYNASVEFMNHPPDNLEIHQLCPIKFLKSGTYSYSKRTIMSDYRYGIDIGLQYVVNQS